MTEFRNLNQQELSSQIESVCPKNIFEKSGIFMQIPKQNKKMKVPNSWISSDQEICSEKRESFIYQKPQNPKIQFNVIILSSSIILNSLQNQSEGLNKELLSIKPNLNKHNEVEDQVSSLIGTQSSFSAQIKKNRQRKKAELKKSNAFKNFANQFVNFFTNQENVKELLQKYKMDDRNYKNMIDNLKKKIIYEKRAQKLKDMKSMVNHKNPIYSRILIEACQKFIEVYLRIVQNSKKMKDKQSNRSIEVEILNMIQRKLNQ